MKNEKLKINNLQKATAIAPANIAFIKYWGKSDQKTRLPGNSSISMNLSEMFTTCTVEFDSSLTKDHVVFVGEDTVKSKEIDRIVRTLDRVRQKANVTHFARVVTQNNFPKATGIASSASGFAGLCLSALTAANIKLNEKELSIFARQSSGTACRSIPDGFVQWKKGTNSDSSFAVSLHPPSWWEICDVVAIVTKKMKKVSTTEGHAVAATSPFYEGRLANMSEKISALKKSLREKDFATFGQIIETDALNMHAVMLTSQPALIYWEPKTIEIMRKIIEWRENGIVDSYFTIDAGPTVHIMIEKKNVQFLQNKLLEITEIEKVVVNHPSIGARLTSHHLF